ncbi:MAG TPA: glycosyltransferase family 2 protein [Candidatus Saccharimonadales bacterium]|nr:glycosyltransferase family 2 protein [Candidatus Saccharimonadales bacterium]
MPPSVAVLIPALNEAGSIAQVVAGLPAGRVREVLVVDNGSTDGTAAAARAAGATVLSEPRRGYGRACWTGIGHLARGPAAPDILAFLDADLSDDPAELPRLLEPLEAGRADLVIGSRVLGGAEPGSLAPAQRFGNSLATFLIRLLYGRRYTDLGPFRAIRFPALLALGMRDRGFGWTVEMQALAVRAGLRVAEVPVRCRRRRAGRSKVSGTLGGTFHAGRVILWTILACRVRRPPRAAPAPGAGAG